MRYFFILFLLLLGTVSNAQTGNYFLLHYAPGDERLDHVCFDMVQDERGIMYFATRAGVLRFDGQNWDVIGGGGAIYALELNSQGEVFWGGANGFGKLSTEKDGTVSIVKLSKPEVLDVYQALSIRDQLYFLNNDAIFILGATNQATSVNVSGSSTALFELFGFPYVSTEGSGNYKIDQGKLVQSSLNLPRNSEIVFTARFDDNYLIATAEHQLYVCSENLNVRPVKLEDEQYINASVIVSAAWINRHLVALGTLRGGVIFINPYTGKTEQTINYNTGLPDNEVFTLLCDSNKNIWAAHEYGFTRISPFLPFRSFNHYGGLRGNLLCSETFNNQVYVGTSLGLFKLVREQVYEEIVYYVDVPVKQATAPTVTSTPQEPEKQEGSEKKKRGFLRFLKRRDKIEETPNEELEKSAAAEKEQAVVLTKKVKKTEKILRSSQYAYKKVNGIEAKITHLTEVNGKLVASGLAGVFEINDLTATAILEEPARFIFNHQNQLLVSTHGNTVQSLQNEGKQWRSIKSFPGINDQINFVLKGQQALWLCSLDKIYKLDSEDKVIGIEFPNPNFSKIIGIELNSHLVIANGEGFFSVDQQNKLIKIDSLPSPRAYFASGGGIWYHDNHGWKVLGEVAAQSNIHLLNIFPDLRFIAPEQQSDNLWIITGDNELYKFYGEKLSLTDIHYPLFIRSIQHDNKKMALDKTVVIDQENGTLTVEVVHPFFAGARTAEYRYYLKGLNNEWSEWSNNNNEMNFPYLPPGQYTLMAQARDAFNSIAELAPIRIDVFPPYWKRPWFYAMEFAAIAMLVLLSFRLSSRLRIVSRLLSLLTIILLIEFIQTVAGSTFTTNSSPVIDFIIQVVIAFLVLPIEGFLRNLMFNSMNSNSRIYQIITGIDNRQKHDKKIKP